MPFSKMVGTRTYVITLPTLCVYLHWLRNGAFRVIETRLWRESRVPHGRPRTGVGSGFMKLDFAKSRRLLKMFDPFRSTLAVISCKKNPSAYFSYSSFYSENIVLYHMTPIEMNVIGKTIPLLLLLLFLDGHFLQESNELRYEIIERTAIFFACNLTQIPWVPMNTTFLILSNNYLTEVNSSSFSLLLDLLVLKLDGQKTEKLTPYLFGKLSKLLHLNIAENKINRIETNAFHGLQNLQMLNISYNLLGELYNDYFDGLTSLVELYLNDNHIGIIQDYAFQNLPKLRTLDLTNNAIMTLVFCEYLPLLHSIGLKGNKLISVQSAKVKTSIVNFSRNQLSNIAEFFYFLKNNMIEYAAIQKNQLSICNYHVSIPKNHSLLYLDLSDNMIQLIWENGQCWDMFRNFSALQSINLANNHIRFLPKGVFSGLTSLQELNLSSNFLTHVMSDLLPVNLHTLDVSKNQLLSPNPDVFFGLGTIDLRHNQFICECPLVDFLIWFNTTNVTLAGDRHDIYCAYPDRLRFVPLDFMEFSGCDEPTLEPLMFALFVFTTVIIVTFMTTVIVYNHFRGFFFGFYKRLIKSVLEEKVQEEKTSKFDAYLCYARKDFPWVENVFIRNLDSDYGEQNHFGLCFEERNFIPGEDHIVNIRDAIWNSKKTICVVTKHFLQDGWCVEAFNYAQSRYFTELKNVLIMVVVGSLSEYQLKKYKPIRAYIQRCEYLTWPEDDQDVEWFLSRLSYKILREEKIKNKDLKVRTISRPGPFAEKQPQRMMFPPPCFTVGNEWRKEETLKEEVTAVPCSELLGMSVCTIDSMVLYGSPPE
ncbi:unnamed protein product [Ranitomeya imitator]|uniref:TIR domain-containing protein n=1 Tax=Ranitomeya imitator TaxID=111125 RepID=A0ABN9M260_9NEOB|nr:unnamed protein product [Ranitomeya imitator]